MFRTSQTNLERLDDAALRQVVGGTGINGLSSFFRPELYQPQAVAVPTPVDAGSDTAEMQAMVESHEAMTAATTAMMQALAEANRTIASRVA